MPPDAISFINAIFPLSMKKLILVLGVICLFGCGRSLDGTYSDSLGITNYKFESNGKVYISTPLGIETEQRYAVDGAKVRIGEGQGNIVMTVLGDGSISGPMGIRLVKAK